MIRRYSRFIQNINQIKLDTPNNASSGTRGGILLSIELAWVPFTFSATETDVPRGGDIWVLVGDTAGSRPILGQTIDTANSAIVLSAGGVWEWSHPFINSLQDADSIISKLGNSAGKEPVGAYNGYIQIAVQPGNPTYPHSMTYNVVTLEYE